jgi:hypothetical protein
MFYASFGHELLKAMHFLIGNYSVHRIRQVMLQLKLILVAFVVVSGAACGRIDAHKRQEASSTTEANEKPHIHLLVEQAASVSEDHIKVLNVQNQSIYDSKANGKPGLFRKMVEKLHALTQTDFDETETTTELRPESTSHSHVFERTAQTKTTVHKTKTDKAKSTTEMSSTSTTTTSHSRSKRSFTKDELESFSEMGKVFTESFKRFNDDATKAQKDFDSFMVKLDELTKARDSQ